MGATNRDELVFFVKNIINFKKGVSFYRKIVYNYLVIRLHIWEVGYEQMSFLVNKERKG